MKNSIDKDNNIDLSIVIPTFNGVGNLKSLYTELNGELGILQENYEVIFVVDGSEDNSMKILREIYSRDDSLKVIKFDRNYGQHSALYAGMEISQGDIILTLNDDMINSVKEINRFIEVINSGKEVVFGRRELRTYIPFIRKLVSFLINYSISLIIGVQIHDPGCGLKCFRRKVLNNVENHLRLIRRLREYKFKELKISSSNSLASRYNLSKLIRLFIIIVINVFWKNTLTYQVEEQFGYQIIDS